MIPVNTPLLDGNEKKYLAECIDTGWISSEGPFVSRFEELFAARMGRKFGVSASNGSAALDMAIAALGIGGGDEVIMPSFTIISCAAAVVRSGATPVLVDTEPRTWNMDVGQVEDKIGPRTKAIMAVHIYGLPVDMDPLLRIADSHGLKVVEDAAQMHGQTYRDRPCGSFGDISTFSFYPNKHVTTGEGGMVVTDDSRLLERCRSLRNLCFQSKQRFLHEELGWNFRMSNIQAALGLAQLERLDQFVQKKRRMGARYTELLSDIPQIELPLAEVDYARSIYWVYGILLRDEARSDAKEAMDRLAKEGIGTRPFFWPMHQQPVFKKRGLFQGESYPVAERLARDGFYIPSGLGLKETEMAQVSSALHGLFAKSAR